jgi:hypothetical protein
MKIQNVWTVIDTIRGCYTSAKNASDNERAAWWLDRVAAQGEALAVAARAEAARLRSEA